jgi:hypothetical protein
MKERWRRYVCKSWRSKCRKRKRATKLGEINARSTDSLKQQQLQWHARNTDIGLNASVRTCGRHSGNRRYLPGEDALASQRQRWSEREIRTVIIVCLVLETVRIMPSPVEWNEFAPLSFVATFGDAEVSFMEEKSIRREIVIIIIISWQATVVDSMLSDSVLDLGTHDRSAREVMEHDG